MTPKRSVLAIIALLFPVLCAALGFAAAAHLFPASEWKKAALTLLGFIAASGIVIAASRTD